MPLVAAVLGFALQLLWWLFVARFILDLMLSVNPAFRPRGVILVVVEITMTVTDVLLKPIRKVIKPIRFGQVQLDFSWTVAILLVGLLQALVARIG
jgi:YggT family protein